MRKTVQILFLFLLICFEGNSQFLNYDIQDGLSFHIVDDVCEDDEGYVYAATSEGLNVFDGSKFKIYNQFNTNGFSNKISSVLPLEKGYVIIGSQDKGLFLFDKFKNIIIPLTLVTDILQKNLSISSLALSSDKKTIWVADKSGKLFSFKTSEIDSLKLAPYTVKATKVTEINTGISVIYPLEGFILIGGGQSEITRIATNSTKYIIDTPFEAEGATRVHSINSTNNSLFIGTNVGVYKFENNHTNSKQISKKPWTLAEIIIRTITSYNNFVWVGTEGNGLYKFSIDGGLIEHYINEKNKKNGLNSKYILCSFVDSNENLWLGTWLGGMHVLDLKKYNHSFVYDKDNENDLFSNIIWAIAKTSDGEIKLGTHGNGLTTYKYADKNYKSILSDIENKSISSLYWDADTSYLFIGTWGFGVKIYDTSKNKLVTNKFNFNKVKNNRIYSIARGPNNQIWIGTFKNGLFRYSEKKQELESIRLLKNMLPEDDNVDIRQILIDKNNKSLWVGSTKKGLFHVNMSNNGEINTVTHFEKFKNTNEKIQVDNLYKDKEGTIWILCRDGIGILKGKSNPQQLSILKGYVATGMITDNHKKLWVSTYKGLHKINSDTLVEQSFIKDYTFYDIFYDEEQDIILGGSNHGLLKVNPNFTKKTSNSPRILFSSLKILDQTIHPDKKIKNTNVLSKKLNYNDSIVLPHFAQTFSIGLNILPDNKINNYKLRYRLNGFESLWNEVDNIATTASYTNVPPGLYELEVQVANQENIWLPTARKLTITKAKPWWTSYWAFFAYILIFASIIYFIVTEINSRVQIKQELKIEKIKHEQDSELHEQKLAFFTNISHDLRTPLTLIIGPIEEIIENNQGDKIVQKKLKRVLKNSKMLMNLVNQILNFRKAETENLTLNTKQIELNCFIKNVYKQFHELSKTKKIDLELSLSEKNIILTADPDKLQSILFNLLSNAIKFTPKYGNINIETRLDEDHIIISVKDSGIGISNSDLKNIFTRFFRAKNNKAKGTGIGLALTKKYIDAHNGHIDVISQVDVGSEFTIYFPILNALNSNKNTPTFNTNEIENSIPFNKSNNKHKKPRILIVDDSEDIRDYLSEILQEDYKLYTAENAKDGLAITNKKIPDLIVSDVMMDGMDGIEMCGIIKSNINTSHIPIILLTAKNSIESKLDSFQKGADAYIEKPFNSKLLLLRIKKIIERRSLLKKKFLLSDNLESAEAPTSVDKEFLKKIISVIEENFTDSQFSVQHLTKKLNLSQDQLYRKIKSLTGLSINHFIRLVRLKKAAKLLVENKHTVSEIVYLVGFNNASYFTKCFKLEFGVLPSDYKEEIGISEVF
ncbi:response regulator [Polaribacter haliotis]|uniref:histidine kinase n=1 Tax=Polaribacter haliotis TaxID=1888915 RepID=A0A7L8AIK5_9FLAO|nr:ATP-binding protein [Polaribacter haliotis]QOD61820.1 response regulator [Polaribacter haliotis]